jgi:hypothetical protein
VLLPKCRGYLRPAAINTLVAAALALSPGRDVKVEAALALARIGDATRATALVGELEKSYAANTLLKLYSLPTTNAAIALNKGDSSQALVYLEAAGPYELANGGVINYLYPAYVRGSRVRVQRPAMLLPWRKYRLCGGRMTSQRITRRLGGSGVFLWHATICPPIVQRDFNTDRLS